MAEDLTGRRLGHYRIDGVLGKGGMSVMYRATDVRLGRKVALKVIAEHLTEDPEFRERFVDEARNTSAIDHANVVPIYDFGEVDGLLFIAMRLVDGSDLASLIKDGPMAPGRALALLAQVAQALDNLHEHGLVHLDVKPANVLVTSRESAGEHVYLADFGLTRRGATGHRTRGGDFLGSPTYAAPEHLRGEPVDGRTDAYSLACVVFACLAGRPPFQGKVPEVIQGHLNRQVPRLTDLVRLPPAIDDVIRRGMAKSQAERYTSCLALVTAARQALTSPAPMHAPMPEQPRPQQMPRTLPLGQPQHTQTHQQAHQQQRPAYSAPTPSMASTANPVRLRPPVPVGSSAFRDDKSGASRWLVPVLVGLVAIGLIVGAIVLLGGGGGGNDNRSPRNGPGVQVNPGGGGGSGSAPAPTTRQLPTSISIRPSS